MNNRFELPTDRLATSDASGHRVYLYPAEVHGKYSRRRAWFHPLLMAIFIIVPWLRVRGGSVLLLDIAHQRFVLLGSTFWAHDAPFLFFLISGFALSVAFVTAVWGRVWCGWACPQTVFIEGLFRKIERWIEGDAHTRRRVDEGPRSWHRTRKKILKWVCFTIAALALSHTFVGYFVGTDHLLMMVHRSPAEAPGWFLFMSVVTGIFLFDFGWFREQFCVIACPYGRIQSVFLDENTKVILYDEKRGEPRHGRDGGSEKTAGDCVNCYRCVQVCPTGVDIRRGTQLECIACTACVDACDEVMRKIKKPEGLIRIAAPSEVKAADSVRKTGILRANTFIYLFLLGAVLAGLVWSGFHHQWVSVQFLRAGDAPYQVINNAEGKSIVVNHFHANLKNEGAQVFRFWIGLPKEETARLISPQNDLALKPGEESRIDFFVECDPSELRDGGRNLNLVWSVNPDKHDLAVGRDEAKVTHLETLHLVGPLSKEVSP